MITRALSRRQREVMELVCAGKSDLEVAELLNIGRHTAQVHRLAARGRCPEHASLSSFCRELCAEIGCAPPSFEDLDYTPARIIAPPGTRDVTTFESMLETIRAMRTVETLFLLHPSWNLTPERFDVLEMLSHGPAHPSELARRRCCAPAVMTGLADRLEAYGYVRRASHLTNRRLRVLEITPAGLRVIAKIRSAIAAQQG